MITYTVSTIRKITLKRIIYEFSILYMTHKNNIIYNIKLYTIFYYIIAETCLLVYNIRVPSYILYYISKQRTPFENEI